MLPYGKLYDLMSDAVRPLDNPAATVIINCHYRPLAGGFALVERR